MDSKAASNAGDMFQGNGDFTGIRLNTSLYNFNKFSYLHLKLLLKTWRFQPEIRVLCIFQHIELIGQ